MKIVKLAAGLAIGYVLGSRAGRETYEKIATNARQLRDHPTVRQTQEKATAMLSNGTDAATAKLHDKATSIEASTTKPQVKAVTEASTTKPQVKPTTDAATTKPQVKATEASMSTPHEKAAAAPRTPAAVKPRPTPKPVEPVNGQPLL
ncbi:hypothetical protein JIG36_05810 [Actinoplanes sp. LDG1-06]|uniref:YtxH domain-containing protein n=1 Tax=Paractinoplanes ovalisporus TaxID=2810368 RepID=A0ABS2A5F0_9ACTN|nr:hypothetical protein [Actinoplanes ovalisporus]MBM2615075.1 hypothetical protein [Actinoplanes ovalisporus]